MHILMLGNSFTQSHDLPKRLARLLDAEVVAHTRGGARLAEQLNASTRLGARTAQALGEAQWDFVTLQEMSLGPVLHEASFLRSVEQLCERIRPLGAEPILFETWAYAPGCARLRQLGYESAEMGAALDAAYQKAAERFSLRVAWVGKAFREAPAPEALYAADARHASPVGAELAAQVLALTIRDLLST